MKPILIFIVFSLTLFQSLLAIDCNSMNDVKSFNGHYYAKTSARTSYETIRVSAMNDKGYLAIPNNAEENEFIKSLVGGNAEAWIGVYDPNHAKNYCYDNTSCFFDDTRFRDVKGQVLTYKNWADYEPNNFVELTDIDNSVAVVDPLGENWVVMNGNTGKWYDVGNHKNSNQNPRNQVAIVEFDEKPICFNESDAGTDTNFPERVCNTQVFDDNIANADKGTTTKCLFDINGKEYCPQGLADAASYWSYISGDSYKNITSVTDYAQGDYKEYTNSVRDFMDGFATTHTSTVTDYQSGWGTANVGTVIDYQSNSTTVVHAGSVVDYTGKISSPTTLYTNKINSVTGGGTSRYGCPDNWGTTSCFKVQSFSSPSCTSGTMIQSTLPGYESSYPRAYSFTCNKAVCPSGYQDNGTNCQMQGTSYTCPSGYQDNGTNCQKLVNYNMYSYECPSGYTPINNGFTSFSKTDPDTSNINDYTLDDDVNSSIPPASNCKKTVTYSYYKYNCPTGYTVNDGGLTSSCPRIDPNNTTNNESTLSLPCNNATPPVNNCTKIIPYTFYSYECSSGYIAINSGLTSCNKTDTSTTTDTSTSLSQSCNSATPPAANCYKDISYKYYTYSCPAGYSITNYGLTSCPKTDPNKAINNQTTLDDNCNNPTPPVGNCSKSIDYAYYQYVCSGATNSFNQPYTAVDTGLTSCTKTDTDKVNTNSELANSCNSATPPTNNCRTTEYTCNSQVREPVWIDNKWQCSPYPCYGNNNVEDLSQNVGTLDKNDNGWTEQGKCSGTIYIFNGTAKQCRSSDKFFGLTGGGCCKDDKTAMGLLSCNAEEKELRLKKEAKKCHYIGEYCSKKINIGVAKICVRTSKSYCCFNSTLGRIIAEQGRAQLKDIDWGTASNPNCRGFTVEEFQRLDLSQMDLTEFTNSIQLPNVENKQTEIIQKINNHLNLIR